MTRRAWVFLLILASLWGASYMFIKISLADLSPAMIVFVRTVLAALVLVPLAAYRRSFGGLRSAAGTVLLLAVVQVAAPFLLISFGELEITSSLTGILLSATPLFTAVLAIWIDDDERSSGWRALGLVAGFVGVALLIGVDLAGSDAALLGGLAVVLAGLGYALGGFIAKRSSTRVEPIGLAAATMTVTPLLVAPFALATAPAAAPSLGTVGAMLVLGLAGTGVAFAIFHTLIAEVGPARSSLVTYIAPVFSVVYGVTLLGEPFGLGALIGLPLILGGSWMAAGGSIPGRRAASGAPTGRAGPPPIQTMTQATAAAGGGADTRRAA
jgi:drug/metabolite transporter (DMT)-like permease